MYHLLIVFANIWTQIRTDKNLTLSDLKLFDTLICFFGKEFFEIVDFGKISAENKNLNHITLHANSVSLMCVFINIVLRCETAFKTNGPLYKHLPLGVGPNLFKVLNLN